MESEKWYMEPLTAENYKAATPCEIYRMTVEEHPTHDLWYVIRRHPKNMELLLVTPVEMNPWEDHPPADDDHLAIAYDPDTPDIAIVDLSHMTWLPVEDMVGAVFVQTAHYIDAVVEPRLLDSYVQ